MYFQAVSMWAGQSLPLLLTLGLLTYTLQLMNQHSASTFEWCCHTSLQIMQVVTGKGDETYQIEGDKNEFFDDREECREALQYVDELHQAGIDTSEFPWRYAFLIIPYMIRSMFIFRNIVPALLMEHICTIFNA